MLVHKLNGPPITTIAMVNAQDPSDWELDLKRSLDEVFGYRILIPEYISSTSKYWLFFNNLDEIPRGYLRDYVKPRKKVNLAKKRAARDSSE